MSLRRISLACSCAFSLWLMGGSGLAQISTNASGEQHSPIDLPTALRLAGAQNLDVQIARQRVAEARANHESARLQFFPWLTTGAGYRRHDGEIQAVDGGMLTASKQSYNVGGTINAQVDLGDAYYKSLAAQQLAEAASHGLASSQQDSLFAAAAGYFELAQTRAAVAVARESVRIADDYQRQVESAVSVGIAFKGDALRVRVQAERNRQALQQAQEQQRLTAARLAEVLHLNPAIILDPPETDLAPLHFETENTALDSLVAHALGTRPELQEGRSVQSAAVKAKDAVTRGPLVPRLEAQAYLGGLGGGYNDSWRNFNDSEDYFLGLSWRIGPGGLFDRTRIHAAEARNQASGLVLERLRDRIVREVVEQHTRVHSLANQLHIAEKTLGVAEEALQLARDRKEFAVGAVLETIQAEQDLTAVRREYWRVVADYNIAQYALQRASGALVPATAPSVAVKPSAPKH